MIDTYKIYSDLAVSLGDASARKLAEILGSIYEDLQHTVNKEDFRQLTATLDQLAQAQKSTEARLERLALAQEKTEAGLENLAQAQGKTDATLEKLTRAQEKTEARLKELAEAQQALTAAQNRTDARLEKLAQAQEKTEASLRRLSDDQADTRKQLGGLAMSVGYRLEDIAYRSLPELLLRDHGIRLSERLVRRYVRDNTGRDIEINIIGTGKIDGRDITVVGESKSQLSKKDIDRFRRNRLKRIEGVFPELFPILVTHMISGPDVEAYAAQKGIAVYYSYDLR